MLKQASYCGAVWLFACTLWASEFEQQKLQNWHQFRGPQGTGVAPLGNPPTEWSETKNIKWKVAIPGSGSASPIVWGDRIFILTAIRTDRTAEPAERTTSAARPTFQTVAYSPAPAPLLAQRDADRRGPGEGRRRGGRGGNPFGINSPTNYHQFVVMCLDRQSGETLWQDVATEAIPHEGHHGSSSFATGSPVTDGENLYASFGSRGVYSYSIDGNRRWQRDLGQMRTSNSFGEGSSPALHGDTLVLNWDHEGDSFIIALDADTGETKWKKDRDEGTTWGTPLIVEGAGRTQVITTGSNRIRSYDLANGELLWECGGLGSNPIATPIVSEGIVVCMSGHRDPAGVAIPLDAQGDVTGTEEVAWELENTPYIASPVLYDGLLYFTKGRNAILSCVEAKTGQDVFSQKRLPDMETLYSSPVAADGRMNISSREGNTVVVKHGREFEVLATNPLDEQTSDATPAIVGNELILRGENHLYCISEE